MQKKPIFTNVSLSDNQLIRYADYVPYDDDTPLVLVQWWYEGYDVKLKKDVDRGSYAIYVTLAAQSEKQSAHCLSIWSGSREKCVQAASVVLTLSAEWDCSFAEVKERLNKEQSNDLEQYKEFLEYKRRQERQNAPTSGD